MGIREMLRRGNKAPDNTSYAALDERAMKTLNVIEARIKAGDDRTALSLVKSALSAPNIRTAAPTIGVPDIGFKGVRQQLFQRFNLIDLYGIAHNLSTIKTAIVSLRQEVFRRGIDWEPAFAFRCTSCEVDYAEKDFKDMDNTRDCQACGSALKKPNPAQRVRFERLMAKVNIFSQSFMRLMQSLEDDLNIVDDAFLFMSSQYTLTTRNGKPVITRMVKQLYRLDPVFIEFDADAQNRPGMAHHICLAHRDNLLEVPADEGWDAEWRGTCPVDGYPTFPVVFRYVPMSGAYGVKSGGISTDKESLYLVQGEVLHVSKFSPSELYGYSPLLAIYEKALSLIGMDRYLYDYFFERQMPQGVVTTVTDNPEDVEIRKEQILADTLNNPHYIPWLAVSSKTGQGKTEFVRFAYSLDELQFLPVQEYLERAAAGVYGVPGLFMGFQQSMGGLNNESQQVTRMSRGAMMSQDVYNTELFPQLLRAFGITDWKLKLVDAEERSELVEWELKQRKAGWMQTAVSAGFGAKYNAEDDEWEITGEVKSREDQEKAQAEAYSAGGF